MAPGSTVPRVIIFGRLVATWASKVLAHARTANRGVGESRQP